MNQKSAFAIVVLSSQILSQFNFISSIWRQIVALVSPQTRSCSSLLRRLLWLDRKNSWRRDKEAFQVGELEEVEKWEELRRICMAGEEDAKKTRESRPDPNWSDRLLGRLFSSSSSLSSKREEKRMALPEATGKLEEKKRNFRLSQPYLNQQHDWP